ncbi:MAG TPA: choice-of-anchor A family protein [Opitutaceae bacterium]|jgi:choice-of-anchor A domain-containing protein
MSVPLRIAAAALFGALVLPPAALAGPSPSGVNLAAADGYNLVTFSGATLSDSDIEGTAAVGGNATFDSYSIGDQAGISNPLTAAFVVGGNLTAGNGNVFEGSIYVAGTYSGPGYSLDSAPGSVTEPSLGSAGIPFDFGAAQMALKADSHQDSLLAANGTAISHFSTLTLTGTSAGLNVFDLTDAELASDTTLDIDAPTGSQVLINVSGATDTFSDLGYNGTFSDDADILYNFYQATTLSMVGIGVEGSVLAPGAAVNFTSGQLNGELIAYSFTGGGELHAHSFDNRPSGPPSVPDGGGTALMLVAALAGSFVAAGRRVSATV